MPLAKVDSYPDASRRSEGSKILSESDRLRLEQYAHRRGTSPIQRSLLGELEATAVFVESADMPPDVITMNTVIECVSVGATDIHQWTLVYPDEADYESGRLSVLSPTGIALLGARCGQTVDCRAPSGALIRYAIKRIVLQPEHARMAD